MALKVVVPIAQSQTNQCTFTPAWFVQKSEYRVLPGSFELLKNGEEAFRSVYYALEKATKSISIICWGFQPSMYFLRGGQKGLRIGELLEKKALAGVKVRVLCWSFEVSNISLTDSIEANIPGRRARNEGMAELGRRTGRDELGKMGRPNTLADQDYLYDIEWFGRYDRDQGFVSDTLPRRAAGIDTKPRTKNLVFAGRGFNAADRAVILGSERADPNTGLETRSVQAGAASHHQKTVLVDFELPEHAVGFVMGHNTLDEYWDTNQHSCRRQRDPRLGRNGNRPREDFSSRVTGPILGDLFHNFHAAWKKEVGEDLFAEVGAPAFEHYPHSGATRQWREREIARSEAVIRRETALQTGLSDPQAGSDPSLLGGAGKTREAQLAASRQRQQAAEVARDRHRKKLASDRTDAPSQAQSSTAVMAQILRTQPQYGVRDIAASYLQAVKNATHYIYMENQYFRWKPLAEAITEHAKKLAQCGAVPEKYGSLNLFVITNADKEGMGSGTVSTARMLDALGRADVIPEVSRQQRAEDTEAELKAARQQVAQESAQQKKLEKQAASTSAAQGALEASRERQQAAQARIPELEQKLATQQREKKGHAPIRMRPVPGLRVHVCTLVAPDSPGRSGSTCNHGDRALTADERRERVQAELAQAEKTVARLEAQRATLDGEAAQLKGIPNASASVTARYESLNQQLQQAQARRDALRQELRGLNNLNAPNNSRPEDFADWVDVYVHAKLTLIDDSFLSLGSANINSRSMETDSELNIALVNHKVTQPARKFLWQLHTNSRSGGEELTVQGMKDAYKDWQYVIDVNKARRKDKYPPMASLVEFFSGTKERTNLD